MLRKRIQLGLIHLAVAMTLVPINSTLNRVMIKELSISATLVAVIASLPYLASPIQVIIGSYSDRHPIRGYHRTPYILVGLLLCVAGVAISPMIAYTLVDNFWVGIIIAVLAFGAWGFGYNLAAVSYISLASEISEAKERSRTIAVMWGMMILGIILTAITLSYLVDPYTKEALQRSFWIIGGTALVLGMIGLIQLETEKSGKVVPHQERHSWSKMTKAIVSNSQVHLFFWYLIILLAAILGQDILLEPFAAEAFDMSVKQTTRITSIWGVFVLISIGMAGWLETRISKQSVASWGGAAAFAGFGLITLSGLLRSQSVFYTGILFLGVGTGMSTVSNLAIMLEMTVDGNVGMFIGVWGMASAISRLIGSVLGGAGRDLVYTITGDNVLGYIIVFGVMALFMIVSLVMLKRINIPEFQKTTDGPSPLERAALAGDA